MLSVLGPWLHVAAHDHLLAHHHSRSTHDQHGTVTAEGRRGESIDHDHAGDALADALVASSEDGVARVVAPGALHGVDHDVVAIVTPAPVTAWPVPVDRRALEIAAHASSRLASRHASGASARGPPGHDS